MKKSFFGKYFLYRFSNMRGIFVASVALAVGGIPILTTVLNIAFHGFAAFSESGVINENDPNFWKFYGVLSLMGNYCVTWMIMIFVAQIVLAAIAPIVAFNYYNNRALTDTVGSLPLTYNQRFLGDFLAGFTVSVAPFLVCMPYILITANNIVPAGIEAFEEYRPVENSISHYTVLFVIILLSAYTFSSMIASCCGRRGATIFYSLLGMGFIPGAVLSITAFVCSGAVGLDITATGLGAIRAIAPIGLLPDFFSFWWDFGSTIFMYYDPVSSVEPLDYAIMALLIIGCAVGAYFLGKYRKAERIDRDFVYEGAYAVMSVLLSAVIICAMFIPGELLDTNIWLIFAPVAGAVVYLLLELSHTRSYKKLPKALIKYAVICAVCFGFFGITKATDRFGISDYVPNADEVASVEVKGRYLYSYDFDSALRFDNKEAVDAIISEHKKLLSDKDELITSGMIEISYKLKNGLVINRSYGTQYDAPDDIIREAAKNIIAFPPSNPEIYGIIGSEDFANYTNLVFSGYYYPDGPYDPNSKMEEFTIALSKNEEFRQLLLDDLKTKYSERDVFMGSLYVRYTKNGISRNEYYTLYSSYEKTLEFINNHDNHAGSGIVDDPGSGDNDTQLRTFSVNLTVGENYIGFDFSSNSAKARELISLFAEGDDEASELITITDEMWNRYRIRKADEQRAIELILQLADEIID